MAAMPSMLGPRILIKSRDEVENPDFLIGVRQPETGVNGPRPDLTPSIGPLSRHNAVSPSCHTFTKA
jgi:hypothetical protein